MREEQDENAGITLGQRKAWGVVEEKSAGQ